MIRIVAGNAGKIGAIGAHMDVIFTCCGYQIGGDVTMFDVIATTCFCVTANAVFTCWKASD